MLKDAVPLEKVRRALVIKLRHHGDVLLASPVLTVLRTAAPHVEVDALVYDDTAPMLAGHPALSRLHTVGRSWRDAGAWRRLRGESALYAGLRDRRYDLILHLSEHPRGAWLARTLGARWAVAPAMPDRSRIWERSFTHLYPMPKNGRRHQVELNLDALRRIGIQPGVDDRRALIVAGDAADRKVAELLARDGLHDRKFIHLHPASRWKFKCWPARKSAELIDRLAAKGAKIVMTAAPDQAELSLVEDILKETRSPVLNLAGKLSIKELVAVIGRARLSVCVDSMPMHVASATGTPVVALFGPSGEFEWGPWRVTSEIVTTSHPCRPCGNDGCGGSKVSECLTTLDVSSVFAAAERLLSAD